MARRVFYTSLALFWAGTAFYGADRKPDVNLFGVMFLFFAYVVWFYWEDIQAGYAYLDDSGQKRNAPIGLMLIRLAPMYLRELTGKKSRRP